MTFELQKNIVYFLIGGFILVSLNYLAINVNETAAALIWSFPTLSLQHMFLYIMKQRSVI